MAKEVIGANAIFSGPQKGLTIIGDHCYAYSGLKTANDTEATLLEFDTGSRILLIDARFTYGSANSDDVAYRIYMNDQIAIQDISGGTTQAHWFPQYKIIIPPFTKVKFTAQNVSDASNIYQGAVISGKVYE